MPRSVSSHLLIISCPRDFGQSTRSIRGRANVRVLQYCLRGNHGDDLSSRVRSVGIAIESFRAKLTHSPGEYASFRRQVTPAHLSVFSSSANLPTVCGLQLLITVGGLIATGINKAFATHTNPAGWMIPVGITLVFPVMVLMGLPWIPEAPRWLLFRGRRDDAVKTLKRVRPKADVDAGMCELEIDAIAEALAGTPEKGSWFDLMRGTNRRRTLIVIFAMVGQQLTGQVSHSRSREVTMMILLLG